MEATDERPALDARVVLGRYRLGRRLGAGGFGVVHEAFDERLERLVAVKVIPAGSQTPARAAREALAAARLDHPGIVAVYDAGEEPGSRYLISELVHGRTLAELEAEGELSDRDVVRVGLALADALIHAHERGVVHRDLKPQNVMVPDPRSPPGAHDPPRSRRGAAKLTDFGVAHLVDDDALTRTGDVVGTLAYMAPEQAEGRRVDARTDLYALGLVLYEALAGSNPVRGAGPAATARRVGTVLAPLRRARPDLPVALGAAIDRAVRPRPAERGTVADLADVLLEALWAVADEGGAVARHPLEGPARWPAPGPAVRRMAAGLAAAGLVAAALAWLAPPAANLAVTAPAAAAVTVAAVALLPRVGSIAAALAVVAILAGPAPGAALLVAALVLPALSLRSGPLAWSVPALAPLLGLVGLAGVYPALAGRARTFPVRAALGALGGWWLVLVDAARSQEVSRTDARGAADELLVPQLTGGTLWLCVLWGVACAVLPQIVGGRHAGLDWLGATLWAAGLALATGALAERFGGPEPSNLAVAALVAALVAVGGSRVGPPRSSHTSGMEGDESTGGRGEAAA